MSRIIICLLLFQATVSIAQVAGTAHGRSIMIDDATIHVEGSGIGEPLLLLHGFGRTWEDWRPFIPEFSKKYRVIAWDMRGHGRSSAPDTGRVFLHAEAAHDLIQLMDELGLEKVKVIGHSSGGIIALNAAAMHPERFDAIVAVSAQTRFSRQVREFIAANCTPEDQFRYNDLEALHGKHKGTILAEQFYHFRELEGDPEISDEQLQRITARTLVVHGDNDFIPLDEAIGIFEQIKHAHLWIVPNGWHMPHLGSNETEFIRQCLAFLNNEWK